MINQILSVYGILKFFILKKDCKVVYFKLPSSILTAYLEHNVIERVSDIIEANDKRTTKLAWLIDNLKQREFDNPVQLLQSGNKYFCHPGSDRTLVNCYILGKPYTTGFYLWYPRNDPNPFILDYEYSIVSNPFRFLKKFKLGRRLLIRTTRLTDSLYTGDSAVNYDNNTTFKTAKEHFAKTLDRFDLQFLTFHDSSHWESITEELVVFENENTCWLAGIRFNKINGLWILS